MQQHLPPKETGIPENVPARLLTVFVQAVETDLTDLATDCGHHTQRVHHSLHRRGSRRPPKPVLSAQQQQLHERLHGPTLRESHRDGLTQRASCRHQCGADGCTVWATLWYVHTKNIPVPRVVPR